jgi:tetratricopeptide (TPR) repeat protein
MLLGGGLCCSAAQAQIPDKFTNLQVLPKDISKGDLVRSMRELATELGVRCHHCHVGPENLEGMDFAVDTKPTKRAAREMLKMVNALNSGPLASLPPREEPRLKVRCATCHRGAERPPETMNLELTRVAQAAGAAKAAERYRELRAKHYGDGQYDFGPQAIGIAATRLAEAGKPEEGLVLARLNVEFHPEISLVHALLGRILTATGDRAAAIQAYEKALALDPQNEGARRALAAARQPAPEKR